jgi:hypothetical protein
LSDLEYAKKMNQDDTHALALASEAQDVQGMLDFMSVEVGHGEYIFQTISASQIPVVVIQRILFRDNPCTILNLYGA